MTTMRRAWLPAALACLALAAAPVAAQAPGEPGSWIVQLKTGGGFSGRGVGDITVMSTGQVACANPSTPCRGALDAREIAELGDLITLAAVAAWTRTPSVCRDCVRFELQLQRRDGDRVRSYVATWDQSVMPAPEIVQLMVALSALHSSGTAPQN